MPTLMPSDTATTLGADAGKCDSRSMFMDRFSLPEAKDSANESSRRDWFKQLLKKPVMAVRPHGWIRNLAGGALVYAQLQSRLMVNMAGGVMENAGLCLDRFGMPYIPGSAVKGCARRMAVQYLLEAESAEAKTDLLFQIALVFGWGDTDWKSGRKRKRRDNRENLTEPYSDFWWAMAGDSGDHKADSQRTASWQEVASGAATRLLDQLGVRNRKHAEQPWNDLPNFAGTASFLPAHPVDAPEAELPLRIPSLGALELDIVTCHHKEYYRLDIVTCHHKEYYRGDENKPVATDDEDPNPVIFPAVAAGHVFAFAVLPMRGCSNALLKQARQWVAEGLSTFGLGAKTAAGYGWFDCSEGIQNAVLQASARREMLEAERRQREADAADRKAKEDVERKRREQRKADMANLTIEQQQDYAVAQLTDDQFRSAMDNFSKKSAEQQEAIVRALRVADAPGSRRAFWEDLKAKAGKKGGRFAQTEQSIRQLSKQMIPGKEGRMP